MKTFVHDGVKYSVEDNVLNDLELIEIVGEIEENEKPWLLAEFLKRTLGKEQYKKAKDKYRDENGRVPVEPFGELIEKVLKSLDSKN